MRRRLPAYSWVGLAALAAAQATLLLADVRLIEVWYTPIAWWSYVLLADGLVLVRRGGSLLTTHPRRLLLLVPASVAFWVVFEGYNRLIGNWTYVGLPEDPVELYAGFFVAFGSILPGVLETTDLLHAYGPGRRSPWPKVDLGPLGRGALFAAGAVFMVYPLFRPSPTLFGFVWVGAFMVLDPLCYWLGRRSYLADLAEGRMGRLWTSLVGGGACGILWEFWNYWATARWEYHLPWLNEPKIFEMPAVGFLGFFPFALECWAFYDLLFTKKTAGPMSFRETGGR
jgi:hypothetical protein